jgi:hypothetical protein
MTDKEQRRRELTAVASTIAYTLSMLKLVQHMGGAWRIGDVLRMVIEAHEENAVAYEKMLKELEDGKGN